MKLFLVSVYMLASVYLIGAQEDPKSIVLYESTFETNDLANGNYHFRYNCTNQFREETGELQDADNGEVGEDGSKAWIKVTGNYWYIGTDGKNYTVQYVADKGGFQPIIKVIGEGYVEDESSDSESLKTGKMTNFNVNVATGELTGNSSSTSQTGAAVSGGSSTSSSSTGSNSVISHSSSSSTGSVNELYIPPKSSAMSTSHAENIANQYVPPSMPSRTYVPQPSEINKIAGIRDYVLMRLNVDDLGGNDSPFF